MCFIAVVKRRAFRNRRKREDHNRLCVIAPTAMTKQRVKMQALLLRPACTGAGAACWRFLRRAGRARRRVGFGPRFSGRALRLRAGHGRPRADGARGALAQSICGGRSGRFLAARAGWRHARNSPAARACAGAGWLRVTHTSGIGTGAGDAGSAGAGVGGLGVWRSGFRGSRRRCVAHARLVFGDFFFGIHDFTFNFAARNTAGLGAIITTSSK